MRLRCLVRLLFGIMAFSLGSHASAATNQTITSQELDRVFGAISQNNWRSVEKETAGLIQRDSQSQRYLIARLRYIYLFSLATQLEKKSLKLADLKQKLSIVEQRLVIQPWHPVKAKADPCFNFICSDKDKPSLLLTVQANGGGTQIYSFEYFDMGGPVDISSYNGQNARLGGILDKIEINENLEKVEKSGSGVTWFFRLSFNDGFMDYER